MKIAFYLALTLMTIIGHAPIAQATYPSAAITLVVPYPPGASTDILARLVAKKMSENLGQTVIVENKGGAGGTLGSRMVSQENPDGYTFLLGTSSTHVGVKYLMKNVPYDPQTDFTPIAKAVEIPIGLAVHKSVPAQSVQELIAYMESNPEKPFAYASSGVGSAHHLAGEKFVQVTQLRIDHVGYRGGASALNDLIGGQVPMAFTTLGPALPYVDEKSIKVLGVVEKDRASFAPDIPSITESLPAYTVPATWLGFFGPKGLPGDIVQRLYEEIKKAVTDPEVARTLNDTGLVVAVSTPEEFTAQLDEDLKAVKQIVTDSDLQPE